ncbi:hypothetical protein E4O00_07145 [Treponema sp. OMZ 788]|nr:hypothetical protein E4O00_07145 [Treponema sp. OMZ 788]
MLECITMFDQLEPLLPEINVFLQNVGEVFTLEELKNFIDLKDIDDSVLSVFLVASGLAYFLPDPDEENGAWISRHGFFTGKEFSVQISDTEDEMRIFIPGSRFLPFLPANQQVHEAKIFYKGKEIPKKKVYLSFNRIFSFYFLYSESDLSNALCEDHAENVDTLSRINDSFNPEARFAVSAWDFSAVFDKCSFNHPRRFLVRIKDWSNAEFEILKEGSELLEEDIESWFSAFEASVHSSLKILPMEAATQEVMSFAFFLGDDSLFYENATPMEMYFEQKAVFGVIPYGIDEKFWILDEPFTNPEVWFDYPYVKNEEESFFNYIGRPVTEDIIDCFVLDFLSENYITRFNDDVKKRFIKKTADLFVPKFMNDHKNMYSKCKTYLEDHYDYWVNLYNPFQDDISKELRYGLVDLYMDLVILFNNIDEKKLKPSDFDGQSSLIIYQIFEKLFQLCGFISYIEEENDSFFELVSMSLENLSYIYADVKVEIRNQISSLSKK